MDWVGLSSEGRWVCAWEERNSWSIAPLMERVLGGSMRTWFRGFVEVCGNGVYYVA